MRRNFSAPCELSPGLGPTEQGSTPATVGMGSPWSWSQSCCMNVPGMDEVYRVGVPKQEDWDLGTRDEGLGVPAWKCQESTVLLL